MSKPISKKFKLVILGDPNVGKSTFINKYNFNKISYLNSDKLKVSNNKDSIDN